MRTLISRSHSPEIHAAAAALFEDGCTECGETEGVLALLDDGAIRCEACCHFHRVLTTRLQRKLLACLVPDHLAEEAVFRLELARLWNEGRVGIPERKLFDRWARA